MRTINGVFFAGALLFARLAAGQDATSTPPVTTGAQTAMPQAAVQPSPAPVATPSPLLSAPAPLDATQQQEAAQPSLPEPSGGAQNYGEPMPLIPESPATTTVPPTENLLTPGMETKGSKPSKTQVSVDAIKQRIRYRVLATRIVKEPALVDEWNVALAAKTDPEKRVALRRYYNDFYTRVEKADPSLALLVKTRKTASLHRLDQSRLQSNDSAYERAADGVGSSDFHPNVSEPAGLW